MICSKCGKDKSTEHFSKNKSKPSGFNSYCTLCKKEYNETNKMRISEVARVRHELHKDELNEKHREYMKGRKSQNSAYYKQYYEDNRQYNIDRSSNYIKQQLLTNPYFKMKHLLKGRIHVAFKRYSPGSKTKSCSEYGINFEEIYTRIGPRPDDCYHLDHIIPLTLFNLLDSEHVRLAHVPNNLRWIDAKTNLKKNRSIELDLINADPVLMEIYSTITRNQNSDL